MTPSNPMQAFMVSQVAEERARAAVARQAIRDSLPGAIAMLRQEFGASRVVLFGSQARGTARAQSDVDLLVSGIEPRRLYEAIARLERMIPAAHVDLVLESEVLPHVAERARLEGEVLLG
jgi:predicted nucleotidyltransferase